MFKRYSKLNSSNSRRRKNIVFEQKSSFAIGNAKILQKYAKNLNVEKLEEIISPKYRNEIVKYFQLLNLQYV